MRTLVTGATGFVGRHLLGQLHVARVLSRNAAAARERLAEFGAEVFAWDPISECAPQAAFDGVEAVFHLAGESVAEGRWTARKKRRMRESRVLGTRHLIETLVRLEQKPKVLVCASAVGFYGDRGDEVLTEQSSAGSGFLADLCGEWEAEAKVAAEAGIRVVTPRIGIVLGRDGGALPKLLPLFRWGIASPLGGGKQWMPWIHVQDLVSLLMAAAADDRFNGPCNAVAPRPVTNREFTFAVGRVLQRPTFLPAVPRFALRAVLGQFADVLLASQRAVPAAAETAGFEFRFSELEPALRDLLE